MLSDLGGLARRGRRLVLIVPVELVRRVQGWHALFKTYDSQRPTRFCITQNSVPFASSTFGNWGGFNGTFFSTGGSLFGGGGNVAGPPFC